METVKIGVVVPDLVQLHDLACVDILGMMGKTQLKSLEQSEYLIDLAPHIDISYISTSQLETMVRSSSNAQISTTCSIQDAEVQPGKLDILMVPGSGSNGGWGDALLKFVQGHIDHESTDILIVSTGVYLCGETGALDGRTIAGPKDLRDSLRSRYEAANIVGDKFRWIQDGQLWSSGRMTNGSDMVAAYALQSPHFAKPVVEVVMSMAEVGQRSQQY